MDGVMWWSQSPWWRTKEIILPAAETVAKKQNSLPSSIRFFFFLSAKWYHIPSRWNLQSLSGKHRSVKSFQQRVTRKFIKWRLLPGDWIKFQQEDNITAQFSLHPLLFASLFPGCLISTPPQIKFCTPNPILLIAS